MTEPPAEPASPVPDPVLVALADAVALGQSGARAEARATIAALWAAMVDDDPLHRCAIAHALADVQDDPIDELSWDLRALAAADELTDAQVVRSGAPGTARSFQPSLHLNVADAQCRLGQVDEARRHVALARASLDALPADGYRTMIANALDRVEGELGEGTNVADAPP